MRIRGAFVLAAFLTLPSGAQSACTVTEQWIWDGPTVSADYPLACSSPLVVQLGDDNGDGQINTADTPDVVDVDERPAGLQQAVNVVVHAFDE